MAEQTQTLQAFLDSKYSEAILYLDSGKKWYTDNKEGPKNRSRCIRFFSIILIGLGGIFPLANRFIGDDNLAYNLGYISIAIAGTLLFLDKFFGFSSTWMRFTTTQVQFDKIINEFKLKWEIEKARIEKCNVALTCEKTTELLLVMQDYIKQADELNIQDTIAWVTEFQSNISELQKLSETKLESMKPGSVKVVIKDAEKYKEIKISVDGVLKKSNAGSDTLIENLRPGAHEVSVTCFSVKDSKQVSKSSVVEVEANKMTTTELTLPESTAGSIKVVIKDTEKYKELSISVDGVEKKSNAGAETLIENLNPGPHEVSMTGTSVADSKPLSATSVVEIEANKMITIELPVSESKPQE